MIKERNMWGHVLLVIITFGIYAVYWFYSVSREMLDYNGRTGNPGLWTVGLFIPFVSLISWWKSAEQVEEITDGKYNALLVFLAAYVFAPIVWFITQRRLNELATQSRADTAPATS